MRSWTLHLMRHLGALRADDWDAHVVGHDSVIRQNGKGRQQGMWPLSTLSAHGFQLGAALMAGSPEMAA